MGMTEERLRDAATALGSVLRPDDIPALRLPEAPARARRWPARLVGGPRLTRRRLVPLAAVAAVVAVASLITVVRALPGPGRPHVSPAPAGGAASWRISKIAAGRNATEFSAAAVTGPASAWAFTSSQAASQRPVAWRLTGSAWTQIAFPGQPGDQVQLAVASAPSDVWAFTANNHAIRWNGTSWAVVAGFPATNVTGAAVISPTDVWVFGQLPRYEGDNEFDAWHYNGRSWTRPAAARGLSAASALSADDIWAAAGTMLAHWDGSRWQRSSVAALLPLPRTSLMKTYCDPAVTGVDAVSATDVWAVGWARCQDVGGPGVLLHYDGGRWRRVARLSEEPVTVLPDGRGGAWIPLAAVQAINGVVEHYSHGTLSRARLPVPPGRLAVAAAAGTPDGTEVLVVGGRAVGRGPATAAVVLRYGS